MKRILFILAVLIVFTACKKEVAPEPEKPKIKKNEEPVRRDTSVLVRF